MSARTASSLLGSTQAPQVLVVLDDSSQVADARRQAMRAIEPLGFDEKTSANVALAVTEAATNILKHAGQGHLLMRRLAHGAYHGIEILALDKGPGIADIRDSLRDGFSTAGSLGAGMSTFARLCSSWDIYSQPGKGTALRLEFWSNGRAQASGLPDLGAVSLPRAGERANGDAWAIRELDGSLLVMVADGLGHGPDAAEASILAADIFASASEVTPAPLLNAIHRGIASTRGATIGLTLLDPGRQVATFAGVGNISATICARETVRHFVSRSGIVGHNLGTVREMSSPFAHNSLLVMHSDGLGTHWSLSQYRGLQEHHPALLAGVLWRDSSRGRDDVTVLIVRNSGGSGGA